MVGRRALTVRLSDAREAWLEDARFRRLSPATLREYDRVSAAVVEFVAVEVGKEPPIAELTPRLVRRWLMERPTQLRPASVAAYVRPLRAFSRWCAREYGFAEPLASRRADQDRGAEEKVGDRSAPLDLSRSHPMPGPMPSPLALHQGSQRDRDGLQRARHPSGRRHPRAMGVDPADEHRRRRDERLDDRCRAQCAAAARSDAPA